MRAALNMVNGWMFTGLGPYYLKDSSTAQNLMSVGVGTMYAGRGIADVAKSVAQLQPQPQSRSAAPQMDANGLADALNAIKAFQRDNQGRIVKDTMLNYAEIYVYEPELTDDGHMLWQLLAHHSFDREYLCTQQSPSALRQFLPQLLNQHGSHARGESPADKTPRAEKLEDDFARQKLGLSAVPSVGESYGLGQRGRVSRTETSAAAKLSPPASKAWNLLGFLRHRAKSRPKYREDVFIGDLSGRSDRPMRGLDATPPGKRSHGRTLPLENSAEPRANMDSELPRPSS